MLERREEPRARSMFKSAYIRTESGLQFVTLRNISDSGVCLDAWAGVAEGDDVEFCIDSSGLKKGTVRWVKGALCGISSSGLDPWQCGAQAFPPRSVRLPLSVPAQIYVNGRAEQVALQNLSIRGACFRSSIALVPGQLVSLRMAEVCFERANIRWVQDGLFGLRFADPVHPAIFRNLVARLQTLPGTEGQQTHFPKRYQM